VTAFMDNTSKFRIPLASSNRDGTVGVLVQPHPRVETTRKRGGGSKESAYWPSRRAATLAKPPTTATVSFGCFVAASITHIRR
jgi:hypothetical protein